MVQQTLVLRVPPREQSALRERLGGGSFEFRSVPHAIFSVKGEGIVATLYNSGKFVVQGENPELFVARFAEGAGTVTSAATTHKVAAKTADAPTAFDRPTVGSDESGKGDYFGPLVVAAVRLEPAQAQLMLDAGVMDSKKVTDPRALQLGAWLRSETCHAIHTLEPAQYNLVWRERGLHTLLSELHAKAIRDVAQARDRVVIDQFSKKDEIGPRLEDLQLAIERRPRAESELAVAAASILARAEFLVRLKELSELAGVELPKGAAHQVDQAGAELLRMHGEDKLADFAKVHFKNTDKVRRLL